MNIIKTSQPIKLAFGSYRIMGMPKFWKSDAGSKSIIIMRPQIAHIIRKVKNEVIIADRKTFFSISFVLRASWLILPAIYQPTTNPKSMQKIGTPIPIPTHTRSRMMKNKRAIFGFNSKNLGMLHSSVLRTWRYGRLMFCPKMSG